MRLCFPCSFPPYSTSGEAAVCALIRCAQSRLWNCFFSPLAGLLRRFGAVGFGCASAVPAALARGRCPWRYLQRGRVSGGCSVSSPVQSWEVEETSVPGRRGRACCVAPARRELRRCSVRCGLASAEAAWCLPSCALRLADASAHRAKTARGQMAFAVFSPGVLQQLPPLRKRPGKGWKPVSTACVCRMPCRGDWIRQCAVGALWFWGIFFFSSPLPMC